MCWHSQPVDQMRISKARALPGKKEDSVGGTPTDATGTVPLPAKSLMIWVIRTKLKIWLYFGRRRGDGLTFMHDTHLAYWGLWMVPLGVAICFGYPLLVWLK